MYKYYDIDDKVYNVLVKVRQGWDIDSMLEEIIATAIRAEFAEWATNLNSYQERAMERDERS